MTFFKKFGPRQNIVFSDGSGFMGWELVNNDCGILATEDPRLIRELEACIAGKRGGVEKVTGEEYLSLQSQKKSNLKPPWRQEWQPQKRPVQSRAGFQPQGAAPAVAERPAPVTVPPGSDAQFRPRTTSQK